MARVLLTTVHRPLGVESETSSVNIQAEMYHAQVTRAQGVFSIRSVCTGWGLEFIAANIQAPATVLHYPTMRRLRRELRRGYDYIGISFVICTFAKTLELCRMVRRIAPGTKIVLGGYGTVLKECDQHADFVCREEGVAFMRRLLGEPPIDRFTIPRIRRELKIMSVTARPEYIIPAGLGCSRGCDFCCTSHFFHKQSLPLLKTGREIHEAMLSCGDRGDTLRNVGVIDEDFLADRKRSSELASLNAGEVSVPIFFSCLTSLQSLSQYTLDELLTMGLSGVWVGIESKLANYPKLRQIDAGEFLSTLKSVGIIPLTSMILGFDWHDEKTIEEDFQYLLSLRPALSQLMIYSPCPQTPLFRRLSEQGRLLDVPHKHVDGFHALFAHPHLSGPRMETLIVEFFRREYEELGPSVARVLEIQLNGHLALRDHSLPLYRARAREHKRLCLEIYPLLSTAIRRAPSSKVRASLQSLRDRVREELRIPLRARAAEAAAPALAWYTQIRQSAFPNPQPHTEIHRYRQW